MILGLLAVTAAASVCGAVCGALCLWRLTRRKEPEPMVTAEAPEDEGDGELREGILNLMRYVPGEKREEEE